MENKIPTAEEVFLEFWGDFEWKDGKQVKVMPLTLEHYFTPYNVLELMQKFAKLHVTEALKSAAESEEYYGNESIGFNKSQREQILNAYPEENVR